MRLCGWLCLTVALAGCSITNSLERDDRQVGEIVIPVVADLIIDVAEALFQKFLENWQNPQNVDVVVIGRAFRIHKDGGTQVTVTDRASGTHVTMRGKSLQDATDSACQSLIKVMLVNGVISADDLHLPPTLAPITRPACFDNNGAEYCKSMVQAGYCAPGNVFMTFMEDNCRKSCGLC